MWPSCRNPTGATTLRDFRKFGRPRLFFGISPGAMDSMVNHYTAARRRRSDDAYTPDGRHGMRPDYPTIVYSEILRKLFPDVPIVAGGIEASLRRLSHYDYWQDRLRPSLMMDAPVDMIVYGMGEKPVSAIASHLAAGNPIGALTDLPQTVLKLPLSEMPAGHRRPQHNPLLLRGMPPRQAQAGRQLQAYRAAEQPARRRHGAVAASRQIGDQSQPHVSANDHRGDRRIIRPALYPSPGIRATGASAYPPTR